MKKTSKTKIAVSALGALGILVTGIYINSLRNNIKYLQHEIDLSKFHISQCSKDLDNFFNEFGKRRRRRRRSKIRTSTRS